MQRRNFIKNATLIAGGSLMFQKSALASLLNADEFKMKILRKNVGLFTERGGSIGYFLGKEGIVVIDSQFPDTAMHLIDEIKKTNAAPFRYLLNTHHHGDHSGGNISFKGIAEHVLAHENSLANQKAVAEQAGNLDKVLLPDQTFEMEWELKMDEEKISGYYFGAAHTNGDVIYHFENANVMHMGDLMFNKRHPRVDRSTGANIKSWIGVLEEAIKMADSDTIIIFGHSLIPGEETGGREDLKKFQDYLSAVLSFAGQEVKKGVSKETFMKNTTIPTETEWSGQGLDRTLGAAYDEITTGK